MRESVHGSLTSVPHSFLWDTTQSREIPMRVREKVQEFWGLSALLLGNKAERPRKHLLLTSAFTLATLIPQWVYGPGKVPALRNKEQNVRRKPLRSHRPYGMWIRNQGAIEPSVKHDEQSTEKLNLANSHVQRNIWFLGKFYETACGNGTKGPNHFHQKQHRAGTVLALLTPFVNRESWGELDLEAWRESINIVVSETSHSPGKYQQTSSLVSKRAWKKRSRIFEDSAPFLLVIKQSVQENTFSEHQPFHWGPRFHYGCMGLRRFQHLEQRKKSVRRKTFKSHRPYGRWNRNQGALVRWVKDDEHSTKKHNSANSRFQEMFPSWVIPNKTAGGNGTKRPKTCKSDTTLYRDGLSTIITFCE